MFLNAELSTSPKHRGFGFFPRAREASQTSPGRAENIRVVGIWAPSAEDGSSNNGWLRYTRRCFIQWKAPFFPQKEKASELFLNDKFHNGKVEAKCQVSQEGFSSRFQPGRPSNWLPAPSTRGPLPPSNRTQGDTRRRGWGAGGLSETHGQETLSCTGNHVRSAPHRVWVGPPRPWEREREILTEAFEASRHLTSSYSILRQRHRKLESLVEGSGMHLK